MVSRQSLIQNAVVMLFVLLAAVSLGAESVDDLLNTYTGTAAWDAVTGTLTFTGTGTIDFPKTNYESVIWVMPTDVKKVVINSNVRVTGCFTLSHNCTFEGQDRATSEIYGTPLQRWADDRGVSPIDFSTFKINGSTVYINNIYMYNPLAYFVRGNGSSKIHIDECDMVDDRGGWGNHSDGFVGGGGSTISNTYMATGDDAIKVYYGHTTYTNVTIEMIQNCVPIQIGWFGHGNVSATFNNLIITGSSGRGSDKGIIVGNQDEGNVTTLDITINGCDIRNPNATMFHLLSAGHSVVGSINNAYIDIAQYASSTTIGTTNVQICGTYDQTNFYNCAYNIEPVPEPWQSQDIGIIDPVPAGSAVAINEMIRVEASGADIWGTSDAFHYVYQPVTENAQIVARVLSQTDTNPWAKAGVMIRETLDPDSKHVNMIVTPAGNGTSFQWRDTTGGTSSYIPTGNGVNAPVGVKLIRMGDLFIGYQSLDGIDWTQIGQATIPMTADVYAGLCVTSHDDTLISVADFDYIELLDLLSTDITGSGTTGLDDLSDLAAQWLSDTCHEQNWCDWTDLDLSGDVNLDDFSMLADEWLTVWPQ